MLRCASRAHRHPKCDLLCERDYTAELVTIHTVLVDVRLRSVGASRE